MLKLKVHFARKMSFAGVAGINTWVTMTFTDVTAYDIINDAFLVYFSLEAAVFPI